MTQTLVPAGDLITDPYNPQANSATFDLHGWLAGFNPRLFDHPTTRREITRADPLLFALVYFPHHLKTDSRVSFADPHFEWARRARHWIKGTPGLLEDRHVYIAPRDTGKSTWWFLILPMWAAAHGHKRFIAAFAHSGTQAETHLHAFRSELAENQRLREDFTTLCTPARKPNGTTTADNMQMLRTKSGVAFAARGIDAANLGLKEKDRRPDLLLLDDIEPDEASYSVYQMGKRRGTMIEAILPMNLRATVVLVGTVTMPGSVIHQCVEYAANPANQVENPELTWIEQEHFQVHHHLPILPTADGGERSIWPTKWPIAFLHSIRHTRTYAKNMANSPMGVDGGYWTGDDFTHQQWEGSTLQVVSIDPTDTTHKSSDPAGMAVISYYPQRVTEPAPGQRNPTLIPARCSVDWCREMSVVGAALRTQLLRVLQMFPRVRMVIVEGNKGGENWHSILHDLPPGVKLRIVYSSAPKEVRAANLLELYQHKPTRVGHAVRLPALEQQMCAFPRGHDDMVDAVGAAVLRLLAPPPGKAARTQYPR